MLEQELLNTSFFDSFHSFKQCLATSTMDEYISVDQKSLFFSLNLKSTKVSLIFLFNLKTKFLHHLKLNNSAQFANLVEIDHFNLCISFQYKFYDSLKIIQALVEIQLNLAKLFVLNKLEQLLNHQVFVQIKQFKFVQYLLKTCQYRVRLFYVKFKFFLLVRTMQQDF